MIYRSEKGAPLTFEELDGNFKELVQRVKDLEKTLTTKTLVPEYLKEVRHSGDKLLFVGSLGSDLGTVTLPKMTPHMRGSWQKQEYYCAHDWVVCAGKTYACKESHVAEDFEKQSIFWVIVIDPS